MMDNSASSATIQSFSDSEDHYHSRARAETRTGNVDVMAKHSPLPPSAHPSPAHFDPFYNPLLNLDNPISDYYNPIGSMNSQLQAIQTNVVQAPKGNSSLTSYHRKPRKRARASKRAPTTVLTTDTSNFRAMVQEFTGIPAPPFPHPGSSFPRPRLDLFGGISTSSPPNYLLRPFPQNPMSSIFNLPQVPNINLAPNATDSNPNLQPFDGSVVPPSRGSVGGADQALFRSMNQKYCADSKLNKYSASSSSSLDFHGDKGLENVTARNEGIIQSWICSSD